MKALVYHGPGQKTWEDVPDPVIIDPTDVIVQIDTTTICGTDLHILKGTSPLSPTAGSSATRVSERSLRSARPSPALRSATG